MPLSFLCRTTLIPSLKNVPDGSALVDMPTRSIVHLPPGSSFGLVRNTPGLASVLRTPESHSSKL